MKVETIFTEWEKDCKVDQTDLHGESLKIPMLHGKWYKVYMAEQRVLLKLKSDLTTLRKDKTEFYFSGHTEETIKAGWELPPKGCITLKTEIPMYVDSDKDVIELTLKYGDQKSKVEFLKEIVQSLQSTGFSSRATQIKNAIEYIKWTQGG